jgi:cell division protein FtsQ
VAKPTAKPAPKPPPKPVPKQASKPTSKPAGKATRIPVPKPPARKPVTTANASTGLHDQRTRALYRQSVSLTSAQRFAAKVRARRRRRVLIVTAALAFVIGAGWLALKSPWATVNRIEVSGTGRVPASVVREQAESELGEPMLLARTAQIEARISSQRLIRSVRVSRHWPGTLRVRVVERTPVAALPAGAGVQLVDQDGVVIERIATTSAARPDGLPRIEVNLAAAGTATGNVETLRGCLAVLHGLPASLRARLRSIGGDSPDGIWLKLADPKLKSTALVQWGNSAQGTQKARVLTALLPQHASTYDVRSPDMPAVVRRH